MTGYPFDYTILDMNNFSNKFLNFPVQIHGYPHGCAVIFRMIPL